MNIKRIWVYSGLFALVATIFLYVYLTSLKRDNTQDENEGKTGEETNYEQPSEKPTTDKEEKIFNSGLTITEGKRAVSVSVDLVQSVTGLIEPGSFVDVISVIPPTTGAPINAQILLENIRVLAVGRNVFINEEQIGKGTDENINEKEAPTNTEEQGYETVTLEVTPVEAATLTYATRQGYVTLALRGYGDQQKSPTKQVSIYQINRGAVPNGD